MMIEHPIQGLMKTAMENIKEMVDVNTIIGDPVETPDGNVIIPVSRVGFGFAAGGSEFSANQQQSSRLEAKDSFPFGGGSGGGVSIQPIAFVIVGRDGVNVVPLNQSTHLYDRLLEFVPQMMDKVEAMFRKSPNAQEAIATQTTPQYSN